MGLKGTSYSVATLVYLNIELLKYKEYVNIIINLKFESQEINKIKMDSDEDNREFAK